MSYTTEALLAAGDWPDPCDDYTEAEFERWLYEQHAYPAYATYYQQRHERRDFLTHHQPPF